MSWIKIEHGLICHKKTLRLSARRNWSRAQSVGAMVSLWIWACESADNGILGDMEDAEIGAACGVSDFVGLKKDLLDIGWLSSDPLKIHDWFINQRKFLEGRYEKKPERLKEISEIYGSCLKAACKPLESNPPSAFVHRVDRVDRVDIKDNIVPKPTKPVTPAFVASPEAAALTENLISLMRKNNPNAKVPQNLTAWHKAADLLLRKDKRPFPEAKSVLEWCQADSFWCCNILSMATFREKYDQLKLNMQKKQGGYQNGAGRIVGQAKPIPNKYDC